MRPEGIEKRCGGACERYMEVVASMEDVRKPTKWRRGYSQCHVVAFVTCDSEQLKILSLRCSCELCELGRFFTGSTIS